ncbi:hypothetical protein [Brachyspira hyodysenteriae]|uniref:hypothetical protein n=1 Tax=Brachyspira hyodysenteriae TaxID=159 RepID=UPI00063DAB5D|nr:hypothetical protein [Brachyspira hyodysenteriae]KLI15935.1 hypothetical protein SU45_08590 [Brachyspira hyodysenteriae]KLI57025.1 hypothetical protein SZ46_12365 [Brachyspira hyodysenteriae]
MKKLFLFGLFLLSLFALSCSNNVLKPSDYSKEEINKKYPYWQVGVANFQIANNLSSYATITVEEKRFILRCLALMRLAVNTEEFTERVKSKGQLAASRNASYGNFSIKIGEFYDNNKLAEVIRTVKNVKFTYEKINDKGAAFGTVCNTLRYANYMGGQNPDSIPIATWVGLPNGNENWIKWSGDSPYGYASFSALMFHEHLHNIGFTHIAETQNNNVPYALQDVVQKIIEDILYGKLKDKYAKQLDELTAYYYTEYKALLLEDSVFDPSKK